MTNANSALTPTSPSRDITLVECDGCGERKACRGYGPDDLGPVLALCVNCGSEMTPAEEEQNGGPICCE